MVKVKADAVKSDAQEPGNVRFVNPRNTGRSRAGAGYGPAASPGSRQSLQAVGPHPG